MEITDQEKLNMHPLLVAALKRTLPKGQTIRLQIPIDIAWNDDNWDLTVEPVSSGIEDVDAPKMRIDETLLRIKKMKERLVRSQKYDIAAELRDVERALLGLDPVPPRPANPSQSTGN